MSWLDKHLDQTTRAIDVAIPQIERISQLADGELPDLSSPSDRKIIQAIACTMMGFIVMRIESIEEQGKDN